jgi:hypothetical protein
MARETQSARRPNGNLHPAKNQQFHKDLVIESLIFRQDAALGYSS